MTYKIEKHVPMPTNQTAAEFPFSEMGIGDSFLMPIADNEVTREKARVRAAAYNFSRKVQKGFSVTIREQKEGGLRVWRKS